MKTGLLALAALVVAPVAHAQDCRPLENVIKAGADQFEGIAGEEDEDGYAEASIHFFKADECTVYSFGPQYFCRWDAANVAEADKEIAPLYDMAKACLSAEWEWVDLKGAKPDNNLQITEGYSMTKRSGANAGALVRVFMETKGDEAWRQVWLEVETE